MGGAWRIAAIVTLPSPLDQQGLPTLSPTFAAVPIAQLNLGVVNPNFLTDSLDLRTETKT
jgi:hypothetical protein